MIVLHLFQTRNRNNARSPRKGIFYSYKKLVGFLYANMNSSFPLFLTISKPRSRAREFHFRPTSELDVTPFSLNNTPIPLVPHRFLLFQFISRLIRNRRKLPVENSPPHNERTSRPSAFPPEPDSRNLRAQQLPEDCAGINDESSRATNLFDSQD